jgi:hypothetical protein
MDSRGVNADNLKTPFIEEVEIYYEILNPWEHRADALARTWHFIYSALWG